MFCLSEKQFYKYFQRATAQKGVTGENLLRNLETRLDNVLYAGGTGNYPNAGATICVARAFSA